MSLLQKLIFKFAKHNLLTSGRRLFETKATMASDLGSMELGPALQKTDSFEMQRRRRKLRHQRAFAFVFVTSIFSTIMCIYLWWQLQGLKAEVYVLGNQETLLRNRRQSNLNTQDIPVYNESTIANHYCLSSQKFSGELKISDAFFHLR